MNPLATALIVLVGIIHLWFCVFEMFFWQTSYTAKLFSTTREQLEETAVLASNQGVYNAFLGVGLLLTLVVDAKKSIFLAQNYLLICVIIAGVYGAWTASKKIFFFQALPAIVALICNFLRSGA